MGPATDKHQAPTHRLKLHVRAVIESEARPTVVQLKRKPITISLKYEVFFSHFVEMSFLSYRLTVEITFMNA